VRLWLCGVRGSTPAVGEEFAGVGGHTSCVAIGDDDGPPRLVIDAGTGLRNLTGVLNGAPFVGTILLSHLHWDHTHGLPFFAAGDRPDARVDLRVPAQGRPARDLVAQILSPPHFPITPEQLRGAWTIDEIDEGVSRHEGLAVLARDIPHKGGRTFGYRVSDGTHAIAYLSDHAPQDLGAGRQGLGVLHEAALELAAGADVMFHDAQYCASELPTRGAFGHAAFEYALELAHAAKVKRVMLFHHDPARTDDEVETFLTEARRHAGEGGVIVDIARQGMLVSL
jgi:phosphoribosyl 1,2-cyclic phosphodiesterase